MATGKPQVAKPQPTKPVTPGKAVTVQKGGDVATMERPSFIKEGKRGSENVGTADLVIPRLELVQSLSPCRKKGDPAYIEGAEEGMLYNNVTRELYGSDVTVVPVFFNKEWLIWKDRKKGGGFRGAFPNQTDAKQAIMALKDKDGKAEPPEDFTALDTAQHFCLLMVPNKRPQQIVISMSKSKMKVSRNWNSLIALSGDDSFARKYSVEGVQETNANNEDYYNIQIKPAGFVDEATYTEAEKQYLFLKAGNAKVDHSYDEPGDEPARGNADSKEF